MSDMPPGHNNLSADQDILNAVETSGAYTPHTASGSGQPGSLYLMLQYACCQCGHFSARYPWQTILVIALIGAATYLCVYFGITLLALFLITLFSLQEGY
jgi:hypothetical protein